MDTNRIPKQALQCRQKEDGTLEVRRRDGGTNFILRIKEQETLLALYEHDDDDDDNDEVCKIFPSLRIMTIIQCLYQIINIIARHKVTGHHKELSQVFWGK